MTDIFFFFFLIFFFLVKRAGRHFGFFKRAGRHEKGAGRRALQKKPRQNTGLYTHCYGHSLNLAASDSMKTSQIMKDVVETTHEITKLIFKCSPKRYSKLEYIRKSSDGQLQH